MRLGSVQRCLDVHRSLSKFSIKVSHNNSKLYQACPHIAISKLVIHHTIFQSLRLTLITFFSQKNPLFPKRVRVLEFDFDNPSSRKTKTFFLALKIQHHASMYFEAATYFSSICVIQMNIWISCISILLGGMNVVISKVGLLLFMQ